MNETMLHVDLFSGIGGFWDRSVLVPCADGKFRRAPDDSFGLVDGLHRSLLGALGDSIVPQVAERIIRAMVETGNQEQISVEDLP